MGVDISSKLIYGLPYKELPDSVQESMEDEIDLEELDYASPAYDSPRSRWIVGFEVSDECGLYELSDRANTARQKFKEKFNIDGRFIVTPHVT